MNKRFIRILFFGMLLFSTSYVEAQQRVVNDSDSVMRSHDKIYVVMAVCVTILVGLFMYLIRIDNKLNKIEKTH